MLWPVLIAGFTLGAAGSLHCMGMCGPLSLALPLYHFSAIKKFISLLLYQAGRVITYSLVGLLFGVAGRRLYLAGYQQTFSIATGILLLLMALLYFAGQRSIHFKAFNSFYLAIQKLVGKLLRSPRGMISFLLLGMANGLLPCGMVYIALAATLSFNEVSESVSFMAMFGLGTLPAMMLVGYAGTMISFRQRMNLKKLVPVFISLVGVLLILRGLDLGIPFISPSLPHSPGTSVICHP
ncbi:MAG TPA: sulfite exporter TauE/SafE family protein [Niastella sp.]|nr:sulfite exporter TauE/SafE family protein [Niastella sp.]